MDQKYTKLETFFKNIHQEIIDRCREGDQKAQFQLYKLYYKAMYSVSLRLVNNETDAEDIMQESFLKAFKKINTYMGEVSFGSWLKRIVINSSLDYLRKKKVQFDQIRDHMMEKSEEDYTDCEVDVELIKKAISRLPDGYRTVLSLYLIEGYDHEEISGILGISNSASRTQYSRAKSKLRKLLKGKEIILYN